MALKALGISTWSSIFFETNFPLIIEKFPYLLRLMIRIGGSSNKVVLFLALLFV
jgi:hypothetical protein